MSEQAHLVPFAVFVALQSYFWETNQHFLCENSKESLHPSSS